LLTEHNNGGLIEFWREKLAFTKKRVEAQEKVMTSPTQAKPTDFITSYFRNFNNFFPIFPSD